MVAYNGTAKTALKEALIVIEGERLRAIDPRPEDREPILVVPKVGVIIPMPGVDVPVVLAKGPIKGNIIKKKYRDIYKKNGDYSCGDDIACEMRAFIAEVKDGHMRVNLDKLKEVAVTNGVWKDSYANLNPGQRRMTIGNCIRNKFKAGDPVDIGGAIWQATINV